MGRRDDLAGKLQLLVGFDPATGSVVASYSGGYRAAATEADGHLIISGWGTEEGIHRFEPGTGTFTTVVAGAGSDNPDLAIGTDGTIWRTNLSSLVGFDPATGSVVASYSGGYRAVATVSLPEPSIPLLIGALALLWALWSRAPLKPL